MSVILDHDYCDVPNDSGEEEIFNNYMTGSTLEVSIFNCPIQSIKQAKLSVTIERHDVLASCPPQKFPRVPF